MFLKCCSMHTMCIRGSIFFQYEIPFPIVENKSVSVDLFLVCNVDKIAG